MSWGRATVGQGSSSFGIQGPAGRHGLASQAEGRCWVGHPGAHCWEAGWPCWCSRAVGAVVLGSFVEAVGWQTQQKGAAQGGMRAVKGQGRGQGGGWRGVLL